MIEAHSRDCAVSESSVKSMMYGGSSSQTLGPIRELQGRISFATIQKLCSLSGGTVTFKVTGKVFITHFSDSKTINFIVKYPMKALDKASRALYNSEASSHQGWDQILKPLESKLSDIFQMRTDEPGSRKPRKRLSSSGSSYIKFTLSQSPSETDNLMRVFGNEIERVPNANMPNEMLSPFVGSPNLASPTSEEDNPFEKRLLSKQILYIGDYKAATPEYPVMFAPTVRAAEEMINSKEQEWILIVIQIILDSRELDDLLSYMRFRDVYVPVIGNRDCATSQSKLFSSLIKFPITPQQLDELYQQYTPSSTSQV